MVKYISKGVNTTEVVAEKGKPKITNIDSVKRSFLTAASDRERPTPPAKESKGWERRGRGWGSGRRGSARGAEARDRAGVGRRKCTLEGKQGPRLGRYTEKGWEYLRGKGRDGKAVMCGRDGCNGRGRDRLERVRTC